jgi:MoaA/NifB/PqqE/SkfB family radical SAM enzyme
MKELPSETYCIFPFMHLCSLADGQTKPCGIAEEFQPAMNLNDMTAEEIFNSDKMKQLRKDMMTGKRNKVCEVCYKKEDLGESSVRQFYNSNDLWHHPEVNDDYSVESQFQHIDIRFTNLCNFKCRMCGHDSSSHWYEDAKIMEPEFMKGREKVISIRDNIVDELIPHLKGIKSIYFAGGEPLIMPGHFKILRWLYNNMPIDEDRDCRQLRIHYNTNLSITKFEETDLVEMWKGFKKVFLSISCDGIGEIGEYIRTGWNHDVFVENMEKVRKYFIPYGAKLGDKKLTNELHYNFQFTATIWNVHHIFDFIKFMKEKKFIKSTDNIDFYYAWQPPHSSLNNLTPTAKESVKKLFKEKMKTISSKKTKKELKAILTFMDSTPSVTPEYVKEYNDKLDNLRNSFLKLPIKLSDSENLSKNNLVKSLI